MGLTWCRPMKGPGRGWSRLGCGARMPGTRPELPVFPPGCGGPVPDVHPDPGTGRTGTGDREAGTGPDRERALSG